MAMCSLSLNALSSWQVGRGAAAVALAGATWVAAGAAATAAAAVAWTGGVSAITAMEMKDDRTRHTALIEAPRGSWALSECISGSRGWSARRAAGLGEGEFL